MSVTEALSALSAVLSPLYEMAKAMFLKRLRLAVLLGSLIYFTVHSERTELISSTSEVEASELAETGLRLYRRRRVGVDLQS